VNQSQDRISDPWMAAGLSILVPGLGQLYAGRPWRAAIFFAGSLASLAGVGACILSETRYSPVELAGWFMTMVIFEPGSWFDAFFLARRRAPNNKSGPLEGYGNASRTAALGAVFPGLGHLFLYFQRWYSRLLLAPIFLAPALVMMLATSLEAPPAPGWPRWLMRWPDWLALASGTALSAVAIAHGWYAAFRRTGQRARFPRLPAAIGVLALAGWTIGQLPWTSWIKDRVQSFKIPSSSMEPTLLIGDRLWAKRVPEFRRGDIIIFRPPDVPDQDYIKRVIGLPEDRLELRNNGVYINGRRLDEPYAVYRPTGSLKSRFGPFRVPDGEYFVMGDNRDNSRDSRYFGSVPKANVFGRAYKLFWPWRRVGTLK
jgi:signal peptidase I